MSFNVLDRIRLKKTLPLHFFILTACLVAQQHPIAVETAEILESGKIQTEFGASQFLHQPFPLSGLKGNLTKIGTVRFCISLGEFVELQTDGTLLNVLDVKERKPSLNSTKTTSKDPTADIGDFSVWTKFGLFTEYSSGIGIAIRFGVQLPNASNESGLGIDEMNFFSSLLFQKHFAGKWTLNTGLGILSDPQRIGSQHDVLIYGFEYFLPINGSTYVLVQTAGRTGHDGIGVRRLANAKFGLEKSFGEFSIKGFCVVNFSPSDNAQGLELSFHYSFQAIGVINNHEDH